MLEKTWKTMHGEKVDDVGQLVRELSETAERVVHVGTDSQQDGRLTQFVSVIVVLQPGKGGRAFYFKESVPRIKSLRERLFREVSTSVQIGLELSQILSDDTKMTVHVDANTDVRFKSAEYVQELVGYVVGQGFEALMKPDAWAATHAADHVVKGMVVGR